MRANFGKGHQSRGGSLICGPRPVQRTDGHLQACREQRGYLRGRNSQGTLNNRRGCPVGSDEDTAVSWPMSTKKRTTVQRPDWMANLRRHQGKQMVTSVPSQGKDATMDDSGDGEQRAQQISRDSF